MLQHPSRVFFLFCLACFFTGLSGSSVLVAAPTTAAKKRVVPTGTTNFSSKEGAFAVYFPVKPRQTGTAKQSRFICRVGSVTYAVDSSRAPASLGIDMNSPAARAELKKTFDRVQTNLIKAMGGKLKTSRDVVLNGVLGRQYTASAVIKGVSALCTMHIYAAPKFAYLVMAMGGEKDCQTQRAQIEKFLGSFRPTSA